MSTKEASVPDLLPTLEKLTSQLVLKYISAISAEKLGEAPKDQTALQQVRAN